MRWRIAPEAFDLTPSVYDFDVTQFDARAAHSMPTDVLEEYLWMGQAAGDHAPPDVTRTLLQVVAPSLLDDLDERQDRYACFYTDDVLFPWLAVFPRMTTVFLVDRAKKTVTVVAFAQTGD